MATAAAMAHQLGVPSRVRALDKDLWQVVTDDSPGIVLEDPRTNQTIREEDVHKRWCPPLSTPRLLSLIGDSSDNIPGAPEWVPKLPPPS